VSAPHRLSESIRDAVVERDNERFISAASAWEIAIKQRLGKLSFPLDRFAEQVAALAAQVLSITPAHGIAAGALPLHHRDPFDRMLIAQARTEGLVLVTSDMSIARYDVALLSQ
jgi:PIN domain nuclease of toxin-antitoxin system